MKATKGTVIITLGVMFACGDSSQFRTASLALDAIPEQVSTLSIFVQDVINQKVVATATLTAGQNAVLLGVPAEQQLLFSAVGYTDSPGPEKFENMPAFVARSRRTIPLDRDRVDVSLTANRAGVLTYVAETPDAVPFAAGLRLEIQPEVGTSAVFPLELPANSSRATGSMVLAAGRYKVRLIKDSIPSESWVIDNDRGIYVAPEFESVTQLIITENPLPRVTKNDAVELILETVDGSTLTQAYNVVVGKPISLKVRQELEIQGLGRPVSATWRLRKAPIDCLHSDDSRDSGEFIDLENMSLVLTPVCKGRAEIIVSIQTEEGNAFWQSRNLNLLEAGDSSGPATDLVLSVFDSSELARSTALRFELLDAEGLYSASLPGEIDMSETDDWITFPSGPSIDLATFKNGLGYRAISRLSGPRGLDLVARAVVTSTAIAQTITSTVSIPTVAESLVD
ncbi:MAG: hypothetical protein VYC39_06545 [Myxococcota bacterium]|nr:hypothetical protein [Myxococcota bacterium]